MDRDWFNKLRARQFEKQLEAARREGFERGRRWKDAQERVAWLDAQLAIATKNEDVVRCEEILPPLRVAFQELLLLNEQEAAENVRLAKMIEKVQAGKRQADKQITSALQGDSRE